MAHLGGGKEVLWLTPCALHMHASVYGQNVLNWWYDGYYQRRKKYYLGLDFANGMTVGGKMR